MSYDNPIAGQSRNSDFLWFIYTNQALYEASRNTGLIIKSQSMGVISIKQSLLDLLSPALAVGIVTTH